MSETVRDRSFLGTGWAFPPRFDPTTGAVVLVSDEDDIRQSLTILMRTRPGERVMHPRYGCDIYRFVFAQVDATTTTEIRDAIAQAILFFEPRVLLEDVRLHVDEALEGRLDIEIGYRIRATNNRANIVFPFYLQEGTLVGADEAPR